MSGLKQYVSCNYLGDTKNYLGTKKLSCVNDDVTIAKSALCKNLDSSIIVDGLKCEYYQPATYQRSGSIDGS